MATITGTDSGETIDGTGAGEEIEGRDGNDVLNGLGGDDLLIGDYHFSHDLTNAGRDTLNGGTGDDELAGGAGNDIVNGGIGQDTLHGGTGIDAASYATAAAGVRADFSLPATNAGEAVGDRFDPDIENLIGSAFDDFLGGDAGENSISGGGGDDVLFGRNGEDRLFGGSGNDLLESGGDDDILDGGSSADSIFGGAGNDNLFGADGSDILGGDAGADTLSGGAGTDAASYARAASGPGDEGVTVLLFDPTLNTGEAAGDVFNSVENLIGSRFDDVLSGTTGNNSISGGAGDDILAGGTDNDTLLGGSGEDVLGSIFEGGDDRLDGGEDDDNLIGGTGNDLLDGGLDNDTQSGGDGSDTLIGGLGDNVLNGGDDGDLIFGGRGVDAMTGGDGIDTVSYANSPSMGNGFGVFVLLEDTSHNGGEALGDSYVSIENVTGTVFDDSLSGDAVANVITGGDGSDSLFGHDGQDTLFGGLIGDRLDGGADNDSLDGGEGDDTFTGGAGADTLIGGDGIDRFTVRSGSEIVAGESISGGAEFFLGFDALVLENAGTVDFGLAILSDIEVLSFRTGTSTAIFDADQVGTSAIGLIGGNAAALDTLVINGADIDLTGILFSSWAADDVISLNGTAAGDVIIGSSQNDIISGGEDGDKLSGGAGNDTADYSDKEKAEIAVTLTGDAAAKVFIDGVAEDSIVNIENVTGALGNDTLIGDGFANRFLGSDGDDVLTGAAAADTLQGGAGADTITGGAGTDRLNGNDGADVFDFNRAQHSPVGGGRDRILDFSAAEGDLIDLVGIDARIGTPGNQAFDFIGAAAFTAAGQLRFTVVNGNGILAGNTTGTGGAEFQIQLAGVTSIAEADVVL